MARVPETSPLAKFISVDQERMHGAPVFKGTRVLIQTLFDDVHAGHNIDTFPDHFPRIEREHVLLAIECSATGLLSVAGDAGTGAEQCAT